MSDRILYVGTLTLPASATWWSTVWGAVGVTNGLTTVSGTGFTTKVAVGQSVSFANQGGTVYVVKSVDSATQITLTAAFTGVTNAATAMGFSANPAFEVSGESRLRGFIFSSVAPAATFQFQLSQDNTNWDVPINLTLDSVGTGIYSFDINLLGQPFVRLVMTDAGAGSTARILLYTFDGGSGPTILSGSTPAPTPAPTTLPATYRIAYDSIVFTTVGGTILQLANPAASGRVLRVTMMLFSKPSVTIRWKALKQSSLTTGGAFTTPTPVPLDSNNAATVGVVSLYTDNTTGVFVAGTSLGNVWDVSATAADTFVDEPGEVTNLTQPIVLRPGQSVAWTSDVAVTHGGLIEFEDSST